MLDKLEESCSSSQGQVHFDFSYSNTDHARLHTYVPQHYAEHIKALLPSSNSLT